MGSACKTIYHRTFATLLLTVLLMTASATGARATLITNGDFSTGDLTGWKSISGDVDVVSFDTIPQQYASKWNLSPWTSTMSGNFALAEVNPQNSPGNHLTAVVRTGASTPVMASCNYAVAWEVVSILNQPYYESYLRINLNGKATDGKIYTLGYNDVEWNTPQNGPTKGVTTGRIKTGVSDSHAADYFTEYELTLSIFNPNLVMSEIIGIDDVELVTVPAGSAPVPEPASAIMLTIAGLAGMTGWRRMKSCMRDYVL